MGACLEQRRRKGASCPRKKRKEGKKERRKEGKKRKKRREEKEEKKRKERPKKSQSSGEKKQMPGQQKGRDPRAEEASQRGPQSSVLSRQAPPKLAPFSFTNAVFSSSFLFLEASWHLYKSIRLYTVCWVKKIVSLLPFPLIDLLKSHHVRIIYSNQTFQQKHSCRFRS